MNSKTRSTVALSAWHLNRGLQANTVHQVELEKHPSQVIQPRRFGKPTVLAAQLRLQHRVHPGTNLASLVLVHFDG